MKALVLGSSGQVGAHLCDFLEQNGNQTIRYDKNDGPEFDLRYYSENLADCVKQSDFVFFLAFDVGGSRYLAKYQHTFEFIDNNAKIMSNVFQALNDYNKPFIFASSQMSNMFYSPYGIMKAVGEQYTKALNGLTVKFWNVFGVEHDLEKSHVITDFILKAKNVGVIDMLTDGQEEREFLYAEDCCEALYALANKYNEIERDKPLHITSFESTKIIDIGNYIAKKFDAKIIPSINTDSVQLNKRNETDPFIKKYWEPKTKIWDGIDKVIKSMEKKHN